MTHVKMLAAHNEHEREDGYQDNELRIDWHGQTINYTYDSKTNIPCYLDDVDIQYHA